MKNSLIKVLRKCGSRNEKIGIGRAYCCRKDSGHDYAGNDRRKKFSADYDKYVFRAGRGKKSFFGGKQCAADDTDSNGGGKRDNDPNGRDAAADFYFIGFIPLLAVVWFFMYFPWYLAEKKRKKISA